MEMAPFFGQQFVNGGPAQFVFARANQPWGFVQRQIKLAFGLDGLAIDRYPIAGWIDLSPELLDFLSVDFDTPGQNDLFARPARSHARLSQELLQPRLEWGVRSTEFGIPRARWKVC